MVVRYAIIVLAVAALLALGLNEKISNQKNVQKLKIRVNVNGIRGKSTATRMITSILHEAGYATVGKTTGSAARFITPDTGMEREIIRKPEGANINEQIRTIRAAVEYGAEALVCECMAVRPEYQDVYQNQMFMANITVIVNVLEDHMDLMGPTLDEVARAFSRTIPHNGILITVPGSYTDFFERVAKSQNTKVFYADNKKIPEGFLEKFEYLLFPDNISIGLAFAEALGIDSETALRGMLKASPDPGALRITYLDKEIWNNSVFVNGFAANEPASSLKIWATIKTKPELPLKNPIIIFNGRPDRVDRTRQFVKDFFPHIEDVTLIGMGQSIHSLQQAYDRGNFPGVDEYINWEDQTPEFIVDNLQKMMKNRLLFGVGNIHGDGDELIKRLLSLPAAGSQKVQEIRTSRKTRKAKTTQTTEAQEILALFLEGCSEEEVYARLRCRMKDILEIKSKYESALKEIEVRPSDEADDAV